MIHHLMGAVCFLGGRGGGEGNLAPPLPVLPIAALWKALPGLHACPAPCAHSTATPPRPDSPPWFAALCCAAPGLRDVAGQRMLSELAALPNVHLAASFDHVNTPLLWDMQVGRWGRALFPRASRP